MGCGAEKRMGKEGREVEKRQQAAADAWKAGPRQAPTRRDPGCSRQCQCRLLVRWMYT